MKYIFDFDDVLFNTKKFKEIIFKCLEKVGISQNTEEQYYKEFMSTGEPFSLKKFLSSLLVREGKKENVTESIYQQIMSSSTNLGNTELLKIVQKIGRNNCYIVTNGDKEFQLDKINRVDIASFFSEIIVVPGSKKDAIEKICAKHKNEKVIFIDDKVKFFEDLDFIKYPNLKTILYDEQGLEKLNSILPSS